jgi:hypothetical protein
MLVPDLRVAFREGEPGAPGVAPRPAAHRQRRRAPSTRARRATPRREATPTRSSSRRREASARRASSNAGANRRARVVRVDASRLLVAGLRSMASANAFGFRRFPFPRRPRTNSTPVSRCQRAKSDEADAGSIGRIDRTRRPAASARRACCSASVSSAGSAPSRTADPSERRCRRDAARSPQRQGRASTIASRSRRGEVALGDDARRVGTAPAQCHRSAIARRIATRTAASRATAATTAELVRRVGPGQLILGANAAGARRSAMAAIGGQHDRPRCAPGLPATTTSIRSRLGRQPCGRGPLRTQAAGGIEQSPA